VDDAERTALVNEGRAAVAEVTALADRVTEAIVARIAEETGEKILVRQPGIMDAHYGDLLGLEVQAAAYAAAMALIRQWLRPNDPRRLGDLLKVIPADVAEEITAHLRTAGVMR
jgi:hypothetical protein